MKRIGWLVKASLCLLSVSAAFAGESHQTIRTYLNSGVGGARLAGGDNLVATQKVSCPKNFTSCTVAIQAMNQICQGIAGESFVSFVEVDGVIPDGLGYFTHGEPCGGGTWVGVVSVGPGSHSLQLFTRWQDNGYAGFQGPWATVYNVTVP